MSYNAHRNAHWYLTDALCNLDKAEEAYCPKDCNEIDCDNHVVAPDGVIESIIKARAEVKLMMTTTLASIISSDPLPKKIRDRDDR